MRAAVLVLLAGLWPASSLAGTVTVQGTNALGAAVVKLSGQLVKGDGLRFVAATAPFREAVIVLESPGGIVSEGLTVAETVRARSFQTVVLPGKSCASMCAIVWLAGRQRMMADGARIGFHAISDARDRSVSSNGNAVIGAYLNGLGFNFEAISYLTTASPTAIAWLTREKAADLRIDLQTPTAALTAVTGPATPPPRLDLVATVAGDSIACERETMDEILRSGSKGKDELRQFVFINGNALRTSCQSLRDKSTVVIREANPAVATACVESTAGQRCLWAPLFRLRVEPGRTAWPAPQPLAERKDADVCGLALASSGRGWNTSSWSAVQEADRRGLNLDACRALVRPAPPVQTVAVRPPPRVPPWQPPAALSATDALLAEDIASCRQAVAASDWVAGTAADALRKRGFTIEKCRRGVLMAEAIDAALAADPVEAPLTTRPLPSLCLLALDSSGANWDPRSGMYGQEAVRRGLNLESCRAAVVCSIDTLAAPERQASPLACKPDLAEAPVEDVCRAALSRDRKAWSEDPVFGYAVREVQDRKLQRGECIHFAGFEPKAPVPPAAAPTPVAGIPTPP